MDKKCVETMTRRLVRVYQRADEATRDAGRRWYADAHAAACEVGPTCATGAGVIAALSPQTVWDDNLRRAARVIADPTVSAHTGRQMAQARAIISGESPGEVLTGPKVRAFFANLSGDESAVTLDRWAIRAATGGAREIATKAQRVFIDAAYRRAARRTGETPAALQAIVWVALRGSAD